MPPEAIAFNSKRHNSLPIPGVIDHLTPAHAFDNGKSNGKVYKHGKSSNGTISTSQPNSPVHASKPSSWLRMFGKKEPKISTASGYSSAGEMSDASCFSINSQEEEQLGATPKQRMQLLVKTVRDKMRKVGNNQVAPAPQSLLAPPQPAVSTRKRLDSFAPSSVATDDIAEEIHFKGIPCCRQEFYTGLLQKILLPGGIDPLGNGWLLWLFIVALAYIYNAIVIFLRCSFPVQTASNYPIWFCFDYFFDSIYILDIILRMRLIFFDCGMVVGSTNNLIRRLMRKNYLKTPNCRMDFLSLFPLDLFYFATGFYSDPNYGLEGAATASILLRLPRLIKVHSYVEFVERFENRTTYPNIFRVIQSVGYLLYMIHLNTCCYYLVSVWEGFGVNEWVFPQNASNSAYVFCLYRAAKTLITIGNLPPPVTNFEIFFMNVDFLIGIFVFATIIGQMRDIVGNAGAARGAFRRRMDNTMALLKHWKIPKDIQNRVRLWYMYSWDRKELVDELEAIKGVPIKMQTDLAIHVHMGTLSKVSLFQDCDKMLLRDLVLKLRPVLYLPGDYICRKGEVGKEMYIIKSGCVQVLGGENNRTVLATLQSGSYFGEISLLSVGSGNRRTADVYSPGYANLFLLDKKTLQEVIVNYPDAQESLKKKAREILKKNQATENQNKKRRGKSLIAESILKTHGQEKNPSKFFSTVLAAARNQKISSTILKGSFRNSMGSAGSLAKFSASDFSSDDELLNNPPRKRKFKRKKSRRRSKSAVPMSTNADIHAADDSDALSAAEKGVYDNKGYLSTDASFNVDEKKLTTQSTEEAIADIMTDSESKKETSETDQKDKKSMLQKQICVDETEVDDEGNKSKLTPLEQFSFDDPGWSSRDEDKSDGLLSGRQFTFDERDEESDMSHPLKQFTFDEMDEMIREETDDQVPPLKQFTFDEMDELEDLAIPPLRQFTFDDSEDSDTEIEHHVRRMSSKDSGRPSQPDSNDFSIPKETEEESDSNSSKDGTQEDDEKRTSRPKISYPHAERIRARQRRSRGAKPVRVA
ncbi:cyclic nucleotide-gated channel beta-1-like [Amphiura filiformis]|uniref:cyclic nucleotide-gated channel beta-1-like n=1 Tax=Amphiura filiformis TaxID=82378 RepID=UPI003B20FC0B